MTTYDFMACAGLMMMFASTAFNIRATRRRRRCEARIVDYYTMAVAKETQVWRDN